MERLAELSGIYKCLLKAGLAIVLIFLPLQNALAICPTLNPSITHQTSLSYCELCGTGQVTIRFTYPSNNSDPDLTNLVLTEDLQSSGLTYIPNTTTFNVRDGAAPVPFDPTVSGANGSVLTWNLGAYVLDRGNGGNDQYLEVSFEVRRANGLTEEGLSFANRNIVADIDYATTNEPVSFPAACTDTEASAQQELPLREPNPQIDKRGRNVDANQNSGQYTNTVYGHNNDDIIWRIQISNTGLADMQDVRFDDLMQADNLVINYACPSEGDASTIANNNGGGAIPADCVGAGNNIDDFIVADPFGDINTTNWVNGGAVNGFTRNLNGREIDIDAGGTTFIYLVGKVTANGSCISGGRNNTVSDFQYGCEADNNGAGGISDAASDTEILRTYHGDVNNQLTVQRAITGINTGQPVGSRGYITVTITNNTGGTVKDILLDDVLPSEYVVDPTYWSGGLIKTLPVRATPIVGESSIDPQYGSYSGMIDRFEWTNPQGSLISPSQDPLLDIRPQFRLWSSTTHSDYAVQENMLRHGDEVTITFPIVLISQNRGLVEPYDLAANLDVSPEVSGDGTDPAYTTPLSNTLTVDYDTFCATQGNDGPGHFEFNFNDNNIAAFPEDLDIAIGGTVFILTNDVTQQLTLPVQVTNNGGHDASDYHVFVTFGATMDVVNAPLGCNVASAPSSTPAVPDEWQPALFKLWQKEVAPTPINIPSTATVYECTTPVSIAPAQTVTYNFDVIKTSNAARIAIDDLTFRADVVGEITLDDGTPLWFPTPIARADGLTDLANNYSMDAVWARVVGFNLKKTQLGACSENLPATFDGNGYEEVQIGEECSFHIETGGWFGFETPGFAYIAVQNIDVVDEVPNGQAYISNTDPYYNAADPTNTSTPLITGISLNPAGLTALTEGQFDWRFNVPISERIEVADEWFRVNVTTRLLNKPIDTRAVPNVHGADSFNILNSTFDATFSNINTGAVEIYSLGPLTVGYPSEPLRRVDVTVTEPNITVTKEVCNETLYGTGTGCTNFVTTADDGDTQDSYIYKITIANELDASGVTHAPAYNITTTDILDASDLVLIASFATDGLDNDGDGDIDGLDIDGESTIDDNIIDNGTRATITSSHTHSDAFLKINAGNSVTFYYRVDPDDAIAPLQQLVNSIYATYDSLEGDSGNQTAPLGAISTVGGARAYTSATATATVEILPLQNQPKAITRLSNTALGGNPQKVSIGEEIEYQLRTLIPVANLRSFKIRDELPAGISCVDAPDVNLDAAPYSDAGFDPGGTITPTCNNNLVEWDFGNQELTDASGNSLFDFSVRFIARVDNAAGVNNTNIISNGGASTNVVLSYINEASVLVSQAYTQLDVLVQEPNIVLTKTYEPAASNDAGDIITVTVTAENTGTATAYNLKVFDDLDAVSSLTFMNVTGADPPLVDTSLGTNRPIFYRAVGHADYDITPGETISFTFEISVDLTAQPLEILDNTIQASWQSLPEQSTSLNSTGFIGADGSTTGMRDGAIPNAGNAINDHETTATTSNTVPAVTVTKTDLNPALSPLDLVEVGVHKKYEIVINLPEGTTNNLVVNDDLNFSDISYILSRNGIYDVSYTFSGIATINNGLVPSEANLISPAPIDGATGTLVWDFGTVVTETEDDTSGTPAISPSITINYFARVDNSVTTNSGVRLQNQVTTNYTNGETAATEALLNTTPRLIVTESDLTVTKVATAITAGDITSGHVIEYVITITNSGNATAYDLNIEDTLPANFGLDLTFPPTATINGSGVIGFVSAPAGSPNGPLIWGRGNVDNSLDIPAVVGNPLILTYRVIVGAGAESNVDLINSVLVDWTSLDGISSYERTGAGCPTTIAPNDYCVGPVTSTITIADTNSFTKAIYSDSYLPANDATVRIGDDVSYRLSLNLQEGTTRNINVQDVLPAGLSFVKIISINGDAAADYDSPASGTGSNFSYATITASALPAVGATGTINFSLGNVINDPLGDPTTDTLIIEYQARVLNDTLPETPTTTTLTNTATLQFIDGNGTAIIAPARLESSATLTVLQPNLIVTKTEGAAIVQIGTPVSYSIKVFNTGDSPAYDVTVVDQLPTIDPAGGMCDNSPINITAGIYDNVGPTLLTALVQDTDYVVNYSGCTLTLTMQSTNAVLVPGNNIIITYDANLDADTPHASVLTNIAGATEWFSQDTAGAGATGEIQTYTKILTDGTVSTPDHEDASIVTSDTPTVTVEKQVYNVTTSQSGATATPGDLLRYSITITNTSSVELFDYSFIDELDALNVGVGAWFAANTLNLTTIPAGADITFTDAAGGVKGTGLVDIRNLTLGIGTVPGDDTVLIEFEVNLAPSIPDGTTVENQGTMTTNGSDFLTDDDLAVGGIETTKTLISSAPLFTVEKISTDLTGDPNILLSGDTLRYTIKVKNTGTEDTIISILRDQLPSNTTYVAGSTTLNGNVVTELIPGTLPLQAGILINTPVNTIAGDMIADGTGTDLTIGAYATIIFDVTIDNNVINGTIISNQGYVSADGIASGAMADTPSDDPSTPLVLNDPTRNVVGNQPLLDVLKTASIIIDNGTVGVLDPDDTIRYTITITNNGATPATEVTFVDGIDINGVTFLNGAPIGTDYVPNSVTLNGLPIADVAGSPLVTGIPVSSADLTPPIPIANGTISAVGSAVVTFDVKVDAGALVGDIISNQGYVDSYELPRELTDADGIDNNGDQPTLMVVGNKQLVSITKTVTVVGGGPALAGGELEYRIRVTNISSVPATNVVIYDDLDANVPATVPPTKYLIYVPGSGLLDGIATGVSFSDPLITADYYATYGNLLPGQSTELVFRAKINNDTLIVPIGTTITNTVYVNYDVLPSAEMASVSVDIGGTPGVANLSGTIWHDSDIDKILNGGERTLSGWFVDIYLDAVLIDTVISDSNGNYQINGLAPNYIGDKRYDIRFRTPGSNATTAKLGEAARELSLPATVPPFIYDLHRIYDIVLNSGSNILGLNLPIDPNGVVYNSVARTAVPGATISLLNAGSGIELSSSCFDDVNQQNQVTTPNGYYKFDLNFSQTDCAPGGNYLIRITAPSTGYSTIPSVAILPQTDATTAALDVPSCPGSLFDAIPATADICEAQASEFNPPFSAPLMGPATYYYLHLTLDDGVLPGDSQLFNNHLPIDPTLNDAVFISKTTPMVNVTRSQLIPYTITVKNKLTFPLNNTNVLDTYPAGFKYVKGSARFNGINREPVQNGLQLTWSNIDLIPDESLTFRLLLIVGAAVNEGEYINRAHVINTSTNSPASGVATATVRVIPDPVFDCTDVIGKVFDDKNLNGYQDEGEKGIAGARVVTVRGLEITTDKYGRYHLTCAVVPDETRGSNFIMKLDDRSLPSGYRVTTENPRVQRATRGKMLKFNFGAAIHRVVSMDMADGVFEKDSDEMLSQWRARLDLLINQLKDKPSILRLSYLADIEDPDLVDDRLDRVRDEIIEKWEEVNSYKLIIETEIFWRRGGPPDTGDMD